jgi:hypothetical protein
MSKLRIFIGEKRQAQGDRVIQERMLAERPPNALNQSPSNTLLLSQRATIHVTRRET